MMKSCFTALVALFMIPSVALAVPCEEIIDSGNYAKRGWFTRGPAYVGCGLGQAVGGLLGIPFTLIYIPVQGACGEKDCEKLKTPIEDGAELGGIVASHAVGFPFFFLEAVFASGDDQ